ncbi:MAG: hypothetical protein HOK81_15010 [Rhodospirillaceae bacterium]|jgi:ribosomal protein S12 methylthiotransferase accessory factor|nr:hypothetical protein [Rhodospirillaceae bacterium]
MASTEHDAGLLAPVLDLIGEGRPFFDLRTHRLARPEPDWWLYVLRLERFPPGATAGPYPPAAAGCALDPENALRRCLGEAVERYTTFGAAGRLKLSRRRARDMPLAVRFPRCALDEPCPPCFKDLSPDTMLSSVRVARLSDGATVEVPAGHVLMALPEPPEQPVAMPSTNGHAFHPDLATAIWRGLCELAERDALMQAWWTRSGAREIALEGELPPVLAERIARLKAVGLTARLYDITSDFSVPTVLGVVTSPVFPHCLVGAACEGNPTAACAKALDEAVQFRQVLRNRKAPERIPSFDSFEWVRSLEQHAFLYAHWKDSPALEFLRADEEGPLSFAAFAARDWWPAPGDMDALARRARRLETMGLTALWTEITDPALAKLGHVVRVVVPEMVPLAQDHRARWLATPRLLKRAGLSHAPASAFNRYPHPYS